MNFTTIKIRKKLIEWLFMKSQKVYTSMFKKHKPWGVYKKDLLLYPNNSLGKKLGEFLDENNFELISKVERHDAYHVLTNFGTNVEDEIALQYLCLGNGKRSKYLYGAIILGTLILPDYLNYYINSFKIGRQANIFHKFDYKKFLLTSLEDLQFAIFTKNQIQLLNTHQYETIKSNI